MTTSMTADPALIERLDQLQIRALIVGALGLVVGVAAWAIWPAHFFPSYLVGFLYWLGISLGCMGLTMLHHLVGGSWGLVIRRPLEAGALTVLPLALLFVPIYSRHGGPLSLGHGRLEPGTRPLVDQNPYLTVPFFTLRAVVYFVIWSAMALLLNRLSTSQDTAHRRQRPASGSRRSAAPGLFFCSSRGRSRPIDWGMSLDPQWTSTIYGVVLIVADALATLALMIVVAGFLAAERPMSEIATAGRLNDLGNLMLAFVMLWAYMSFCQFLIIWSGNLSEEIPWYLRRTRGAGNLSRPALVLFQFFLPFFVLLFRENKRATTQSVARGPVGPRDALGQSGVARDPGRVPTRPGRTSSGPRLS